MTLCRLIARTRLHGVMFPIEVVQLKLHEFDLRMIVSSRSSTSAVSWHEKPKCRMSPSSFMRRAHSQQPKSSYILIWVAGDVMHEVVVEIPGTGALELLGKDSLRHRPVP